MSTIKFNKYEGRVNKAVKIIQDMQDDPALTSSMLIPLFTEDMASGLFSQGLRDVVVGMLNILKEELLAILLIPESELKGTQFGLALGFLKWVDATHHDQYAITLLTGEDRDEGEDRATQYIFIKSNTDEVKIINIFTEDGDVISRLMLSMETNSLYNNNLQLTFGGTDE